MIRETCSTRDNSVASVRFELRFPVCLFVDCFHIGRHGEQQPEANPDGWQLARRLLPSLPDAREALGDVPDDAVSQLQGLWARRLRLPEVSVHGVWRMGTRKPPLSQTFNLPLGDEQAGGGEERLGWLRWFWCG